jgi:precorrin-6Y C5,15-methyltransferase (decarboxylating)
MTRRTTVIGLDGRPLSDAAAARLSVATLVLGGARHLETADIPPTAEKVILGDVAAGLKTLEAHAGNAVVLASGDPGFFGIVRQMQEKHIPYEVVPAASSVALLCARAGISWDDAVVMSAHGRGNSGLRRAINACRALPKVLVLTAPDAGPGELAAGLIGHRDRMLIGEKLGGIEEIVTECTPEEAAARQWAEPNVVLVCNDATARRSWAHPGRQVPQRWALAEDAFEHRDSMVTKAEVRAFVLARLGPGIGDLVWDIGSGSGSVAIECARFGAAVSAVDADGEQVARTARNAAYHQVGVHVVHGKAPEVLDTLADPDAVFIGGGGTRTPLIAEAAAMREPRVIVVALAAVDRVSDVLSAMQSRLYRTDGVQLSAARFAALPDDSTRLAAQNPVFVLWGER